MNKIELVAKAKAFGADLIGVAPIERFKNEPAERHPQSIFPECKSVIVLARRVCRGSIRGVEEGTNFGSTYQSFGYTWVEDNFLAQTSYDFSLWIEEQGYEAVPLFAYNEAGMPKGIQVAPDRPAPNVYIDPAVAVVASGLGEKGLGGFLITPRFGTRQRFAFVLTDAELEGDPVLGKTICGDCGACAAACPFGAIHLDQRKTVDLAGCTMEVAAIDWGLCASCPNGAFLASGRGKEPDRIAAACGRMCLVRLEEANKLENTFENKFRHRAPWQLDAFKRPVTAGGQPITVGCDRVTQGLALKDEHASGQIFAK